MALPEERHQCDRACPFELRILFHTIYFHGGSWKVNHRLTLIFSPSTFVESNDIENHVLNYNERYVKNRSAWVLPHPVASHLSRCHPLFLWRTCTLPPILAQAKLSVIGMRNTPPRPSEPERLVLAIAKDSVLKGLPTQSGANPSTTTPNVPSDLVLSLWCAQRVLIQTPSTFGSPNPFYWASASSENQWRLLANRVSDSSSMSPSNRQTGKQIASKDE